MKTNAKVKNIRLDHKTDEIIITCDAKNSLYIQYPKEYTDSKLLINTAPLVEGVNIMLEHHYHAVKAVKGNTDFQKLVEENNRLKLLIKQITAFENCDRIKLDGLSYQKQINENSFYTAIKNELDKI